MFKETKPQLALKKKFLSKFMIYGTLSGGGKLVGADGKI